MKMFVWGFGLAAVLSTLTASPLCAGEWALLPKESETRWTLISPPSVGAPMESEGTQITNINVNAPIRVVSSKKPRIVLYRSPANARWARMTSESLNRTMDLPNGVLYYPDPTTLSLYDNKSSLAL